MINPLNSMISPPTPPPAENVRFIAELVSLFADPVAAAERIAQYQAAAAVLRAASERFQETQSSFAPAEAAHQQKLAAERAQHEAVLHDAQQKFDDECQRREVAAVELVQSFRNPDFNRALRLVWSLPEGGSARSVIDRGTEVVDAAILVGSTIEVVGVLVFRRVVPLEIVDDLMGDAIVGFWPRLGDWVLHLRREQKRESVFEWFQWLVDRLDQRERRRTSGAHERFRDWKP
jgi:hypothetical protein